MNTITVSGRLTADPQLKTTNNGKSVVNARLAIKRPGNKEQADFVNCVIWSSAAEFVSKYAHKGDTLFVTGYIAENQWTDKDGKNQSIIEIQSVSVELYEKRGTESSNDGMKAALKEFQAQAPALPRDFEQLDDDEELPFF